MQYFLDLQSSDEEGQSKQVCTEPLYVLPLFSLLSTEKQAKVSS